MFGGNADEEEPAASEHPKERLPEKPVATAVVSEAGGIKAEPPAEVEGANEATEEEAGVEDEAEAEAVQGAAAGVEAKVEQVLAEAVKEESWAEPEQERPCPSPSRPSYCPWCLKI